MASPIGGRAETDFTDPDLSDEEFGERFLAYVNEQAEYHARELAKITELRQLWAARQIKKETPRDDAS